MRTSRRFACECFLLPRGEDLRAITTVHVNVFGLCPLCSNEKEFRGGGKIYTTRIEISSDDETNRRRNRTKESVKNESKFNEFGVEGRQKGGRGGGKLNVISSRFHSWIGIYRRNFIEICWLGRSQIFSRVRGQKRAQLVRLMAHRLPVFYTRVHVRGIAAAACTDA